MESPKWCNLFLQKAAKKIILSVLLDLIETNNLKHPDFFSFFKTFIDNYGFFEGGLALNN